LALRPLWLPVPLRAQHSQAVGLTVEMVVTLGQLRKPAWRWSATVTATAKAASIGVPEVRIAK
jgi:hypothetical protein